MRAHLFQNPNPSLLSFPIPRPLFLSGHGGHQFRPKPRSLSRLSLKNLSRFRLLWFRSKPGFQINAEDGCYGGLEIDADHFLALGDLGLPVELSMTRALPPALTLKEGFDKIKEAIEELQLNPPVEKSGVLRFQVAVPSSTKASVWLFCQPRDLVAYPHYHFSRRKIHELSSESASLTEALSVSGIGAAILLYGSSHTLNGYSLMESPLGSTRPLRIGRSCSPLGSKLGS